MAAFEPRVSPQLANATDQDFWTLRMLLFCLAARRYAPLLMAAAGSRAQVSTVTGDGVTHMKTIALTAGGALLLAAHGAMAQSQAPSSRPAPTTPPVSCPMASGGMEPGMMGGMMGQGGMGNMHRMHEQMQSMHRQMHSDVEAMQKQMAAMSSEMQAMHREMLKMYQGMPKHH